MEKDELTGVEKRVLASYLRVLKRLGSQHGADNRHVAATLTLAATMEDILDQLPAAGRGY